MYDMDELKKLYDRLKAQYPKYRMKFYGENFTLTLLYAKVEVNRTGSVSYTHLRILQKNKLLFTHNIFCAILFEV